MTCFPSFPAGYGNGSGSGHIRLSNGNLFIGPSGATFTFAAGLLEWTGGEIDPEAFDLEGVNEDLKGLR